MPVIFFPKLLYIMWHYRAIKKRVLQNKMVNCPIITLCKKAAHPRSSAPLQPHIFGSFPRTTQLPKTRGFASHPSGFHKNVSTQKANHHFVGNSSIVFISCVFKAVVFALSFEGASHLRNN